MDKHIHLGEILRHAPAGLKIYSPCYGWLKLVSVDDYELHLKRTPMIICKSFSGNEKKFFMDGTLSTHGECMLFPSETHRSWDNWQNDLFQPGDIIVKDFDDDWGVANTVLYTGVSDRLEFMGFDVKGNKVYPLPVSCYRYATVEEINEFNRDLLYNGFKWDAVNQGLITAIKEEIKSAKETEKELNSLVQQHKKFNVSVLKPFDKVLYLPWDTGSHECWRPGIVSIVYKDTVYIIGMDRGVKRCIPYKGNEHLVGEVAKEADFYIKD